MCFPQAWHFPENVPYRKYFTIPCWKPLRQFIDNTKHDWPAYTLFLMTKSIPYIIQFYLYLILLFYNLFLPPSLPPYCSLFIWVFQPTSAKKKWKKKKTNSFRFLTRDHRKLVHENFFRSSGDIILVKNLFKPIKVIDRTNTLRIWKSARKNRCHWKKADYDSSRAP